MKKIKYWIYQLWWPTLMILIFLFACLLLGSLVRCCVSRWRESVPVWHSIHFLNNMARSRNIIEKKNLVKIKISPPLLWRAQNFLKTLSSTVRTLVFNREDTCLQPWGHMSSNVKTIVFNPSYIYKLSSRYHYIIIIINEYNWLLFFSAQWKLIIFIY